MKTSLSPLLTALLGGALMVAPALAQTVTAPATGALAPVAAVAPLPAPVPIPDPPAIRREMRGVWIATVGNIDWPSKSGLPVATQKAEMIELLDRAQALNLNAIFFQVRPSTDTFYDSKIEPWSEFLTGKMGQAPVPFYDPLAFTIEEAHKRGLEVHAWFNPYRTRYAGAKTPASPNHISKTRPDLVKQYGAVQWMDPGEPEVQNITTNVIMDVVKRYDVDGIHFDDYFYPYQDFTKVDGKNVLIPFPDDPSRNRYLAGGGKLSLEDWRRQNVNTLVSRLHREIQATKPYVRFGISPFGIWRPGYPAQIQGHDAYDKLYADARLWLQEGWIDYALPQLYWKIEQKPQSYPVLLNWWTEQNPKQRHIWAGQFTARAVEGGANEWPGSEIEYQIRTARGQAGASGTVHFSAKSLLIQDVGGLTKLLKDGVYSDPALVPATTWLTTPAILKPQTLTLTQLNGAPIQAQGGGSTVALWVVQTRVGTKWSSQIVPGTQTTMPIPTTEKIEEVAVSSVDRVGNQTAPTRFKLAG